jgi:hypothetical protein
LSPLIFNFVSQYAIRKAKGNQVGEKSNGTHQQLVCADYVNLVGDNLDTIKENTEIYLMLVRRLV